MDQLDQLLTSLMAMDWSEFTTTAGTSFSLIAAAEMGDKSQLVCMSLASRHRASPVIWGAMAAFVLLNSLAVLFGAAIANWLPDYWVAACVALLFGGFGLHALMSHDEDDDKDESLVEKSGHGIFLSTFLLITVAEFGDKTQLAVVGFSSTAMPAAVWLGASLALVFSTALGVFAGRTVLKHIPLALLHKISGLIFLLLAVVAAFHTYDRLLAVGLLPPSWQALIIK